MDALEFLKERKRMCKSYPRCDGCPLREPNCNLTTDEDYTRAIITVEQWSKEHPRKTRQSVFLEQYPNAKIADDTGMPSVYPCVIEKGMKSVKYCNSLSCTDCRREFWGQEVE